MTQSGANGPLLQQTTDSTTVAEQSKTLEHVSLRESLSDAVQCTEYSPQNEDIATDYYVPQEALNTTQRTCLSQAVQCTEYTWPDKSTVKDYKTQEAIAFPVDGIVKRTGSFAQCSDDVSKLITFVKDILQVRIRHGPLDLILLHVNIL